MIHHQLGQFALGDLTPSPRSQRARHEAVEVGSVRREVTLNRASPSTAFMACSARSTVAGQLADDCRTSPDGGHIGPAVS